MLWKEDRATGIWCPLWLRRQQAWLCSCLTPGRPPPAELTGGLRDRLYAAGILTVPDALRERYQHGRQLVREGGAALERDRYCVLPALLGTTLREAVAGYYRQLIASGEWPAGDAQVERRYGWHNERLAQFLHNQLGSFLSGSRGTAAQTDILVYIGLLRRREAERPYGP